jgi:hypothetical protein
MTFYNVHIYREMRLLFERIEADTPEAAAAIARDRLTEDADDLEDCDGDTFAALVDVVGDDQYEQSVILDFEGERLRKAALELLTALNGCLFALDENAEGFGPSKAQAITAARAAIAKATEEGRPA